MAGSSWYPSKTDGQLRQMGFRYPKFLGGRKTNANQVAALAAIPIFAGESMVRLEVVGSIASDGDQSPDKLLQHEWMVLAVPFVWGESGNSQALDANVIDGFAETAIHGDANAYEFGARPNPGGDNDWMGAIEAGGSGSEVLYEYAQFLTPQAGGWDDAFLAPDQIVVRTGATHRKVIEQNYFWPTDMMVIVASARSSIVAQTDFGVAEMDQSATNEQILGALTLSVAGDTISATAQLDKLHELIYGGDQYIEADTLDGGATRAGVMVKAKIATPWPRF